MSNVASNLSGAACLLPTCLAQIGTEGAERSSGSRLSSHGSVHNCSLDLSTIYYVHAGHGAF